MAGSLASNDGARRASPLSSALAPNPAKRQVELFFLRYSLVWITWVLCILVPFKLYDYLGPWGYMSIGLTAATPIVAIPLIWPPREDRDKPWHDRFWVKANLWIAIFSFIGNYFWTHYFYSLLGASYTFPAHRLNDVPITLYFMTHAYFALYHALGNVLIRGARASAGAWRGPRAALAAEIIVVLSLSYVTAYGETFTIAHFPYYSFKDKDRMYTVGSVFYALYFVVSFPMFYRFEESPRSPRHTLWSTAVNSLGAGMLVTILLDFWRLIVGAIVDGDTPGTASTNGLPWSPSPYE